MFDTRTIVDFDGSCFDGRFIYFAPWLMEERFAGRIGGGGNVLRYDTTGENASFNLRFCDLGHNGGLCAALPGPRFLVNTEHGPCSIAADQPPPAGRRHFAGVYDGETISLYLDGELLNRRPASGRLLTPDADLIVGPFTGAIREVRISAATRSADWLATQYTNLSNPEGFISFPALSPPSATPPQPHQSPRR